MVKRTPSPPGNISGHRWSPCSGSGVVSSIGSPPSAETRQSPLGALVAKTMVSSGPQLAPSGTPSGSSLMVTGGPPRIETFLNLLRPRAKYPTQLPSGETNNPRGILVATARGVASSWSKARTTSWGSSFAIATYTMCVPSGVMATSTSGRARSRGASGGGLATNRTRGRGASGFKLQAATPAMTLRAMAAAMNTAVEGRRRAAAGTKTPGWAPPSTIHFNWRPKSPAL